MTQEEARRVFNAASEALKEAIAIRHHFAGWSINWADLKVTEVEEYTTYGFSGDQTYEDTGVRVYIEEAAIDNEDLKLFIRDRLTARGIPRIEVITEW